MKKLVLIACGFVVLVAAPVKAEQNGRITLIEENDSISSPDDRHYSQGMKLSYMPGTDAADDKRDCDWLGFALPWDQTGSCKRKYDWTIVGQSLFTPKNISVPAPSGTDRPYGAWLYTGVSMMQESAHGNHDTLDNYELQAGVVGPFALGGLTQNNFHQFIGVKPARGWTNEIHNEPGIMLTHERKWRFNQPLSDYFSVGVIPEAGVTLGNIFTYGQAGAMLRFGHNMNADYGPSRVRPSLSGTGWYDRAALNDHMGWYVFLGTQGRAVAQNIFLDGNTFRDSVNVDKKPLVADFSAGASFLWPAIRVDLTVTQRTREYVGQRGEPDRFGGISVAFGL